MTENRMAEVEDQYEILMVAAFLQHARLINKRK